MRKALFLIVVINSTCFSLPAPLAPQENMLMTNVNNVIDKIMSLISTELHYPSSTSKPINETKEMLQKEASTLNPVVIDKVLTTLQCTKQFNIDSNNILAVIDFSLHSSEKRLWVFDLKEKKLLFHTYVSHGIKSGEAQATYFSNKNDSKTTSMGVYKTEKTYHGRHGLSLQLDGLDRGFNDNASSRSIVMHGAWYVDERFIKKYGRAGRSWGCPAVPENLKEPIINALKENAIFVMYYPNDNWLLTSKFQNCSNLPPRQKGGRVMTEVKNPVDVSGVREDIIFADINKNRKRDDSDAVVAMAADNYVRIFHRTAPLTRMIRRQINNEEYIALSNTEFTTLATSDDKEGLNKVYLIMPVVKMVRGYYETDMKIVNLGKIKEVSLNGRSTVNTEPSTSYTVHFDTNTMVSLRSTNRFIRWLGL